MAYRTTGDLHSRVRRPMFTTHSPCICTIRGRRRCASVGAPEQQKANEASRANRANVQEGRARETAPPLPLGNAVRRHSSPVRAVPASWARERLQYRSLQNKRKFKHSTKTLGYLAVFDYGACLCVLFPGVACDAAMRRSVCMIIGHFLISR